MNETFYFDGDYVFLRGMCEIITCDFHGSSTCNVDQIDMNPKAMLTRVFKKFFLQRGRKMVFALHEAC